MPRGPKKYVYLAIYMCIDVYFKFSPKSNIYHKYTYLDIYLNVWIVLFFFKMMKVWYFSGRNPESFSQNSIYFIQICIGYAQIMQISC